MHWIVLPWFFKFDILKGDKILLCTDGLYNEVSSEMIRRIIDNADDMRAACDELIITAHDNEVGNLEEILDVELEGKNLEIAFNIRFFLDSLKVMEDEYIYMNFNTNVSPCIIKPEFETDYTYLVLPVRI